MTTLTSPTISATDSSVKTVGGWVAEDRGLRHADLTDHLNDFIEVRWRGTGLVAELASSTGRKIAVVVMLDGQPISKDVAGQAIQWGEGQSYIFVEDDGQYELTQKAHTGEHVVKLLTRSDKLICRNFTIKGE